MFILSLLYQKHYKTLLLNSVQFKKSVHFNRKSVQYPIYTLNEHCYNLTIEQYRDWGGFGGSICLCTC